VPVVESNDCYQLRNSRGTYTITVSGNSNGNAGTPHRYSLTVQYKTSPSTKSKIALGVNYWRCHHESLDDLTVVPENTCPIERLVQLPKLADASLFSGLRDVRTPQSLRELRQSPTSSFRQQGQFAEGSVGVSNPLSAAFVTALTGSFLVGSLAGNLVVDKSGSTRDPQAADKNTTFWAARQWFRVHFQFMQLTNTKDKGDFGQ